MLRSPVMPAVGLSLLQKTKIDIPVSLPTGWPVGSICPLVFRRACLGNSPVFRWVPFAVPWFRPVRAGQVVVVSCLGSPRVFRGFSFGHAVG